MFSFQVKIFLYPFNNIPLESKSLTSRILTDMVPLNPSLFLQESADTVKLLVTNGHDVSPVEGGGAKTSPVFLEWDAAISFLECWILGLNQNQLLIQV